MKVAVVGNRVGWKFNDVKFQLDKLKLSESDLVISGGASGVDSFAEMYCKTKGIPYLIFPPNPNVPSPDRYFNRNIAIVKVDEFLRDVLKSYYMMLAFNNQNRSGTVHTINRAKKEGINVIVVGEVIT